MNSRIPNCYDSHTHFLATGQVASGLRLQGLKSAEQIGAVQIKPGFFRQDWLTGFGWDHNQWDHKVLPSATTLDTFFPKTPVVLSRVDGHASWVNSAALARLKALGLETTSNEGILFEKDHVKALSLIPDFSDHQIKYFFEVSQRIFHAGGFTHVRDLSMNLKLWNLLCEFHEENKLKICIDAFVTAESIADLPSVLFDISEMKKSSCPFLRIQGVKIFVDGSLGSKTAYLSENYAGDTTRGQFHWDPADIESALRTSWSAGLEVAVHTIGDQAAHEVVKAARHISAEGILGRLHLEHIEILRSETVQMMKPLHVTCHLQPSHWLSDSAWLKQVLPMKLQQNIFQWELLRKNKIPFFFGSDSPIECPALFATPRALELSAQGGVPALSDDWKKYHAHPDPNWTKSWTEFNENQIVQVYFDGQPLLQKVNFTS